MAYPKWEPTPEILKQVSELAHKGVTEASIARIVGLTPNTFSTKKKEYPELGECLKKAHAHGEDEVVGYLWNIIKDTKHKHHFSACLFYLKTKHLWREVAQAEPTKELPTTVPFKLKSVDDVDEDVAA